MKASTRIWGCSFDGLKDHMVLDGAPIPCWRERGFRPADVVLPTQTRTGFKTGFEAMRSRVALGLGWPPEARAFTHVGSRRVPVPLAWRVLIDAHDHTAYWSLESGLSFSVSSILVSHILNILVCRGVSQRNDRIVIAIPNDLDETGQESLIREMQESGFSNLELLWRSVAAALAWLDIAQAQIPSDCNDDDAIVVVHVGPDAIECVSFRLRERIAEDGKRFMVPVRDVPQRSESACGSDWAFGLSEKAASGSGDFGAVWQIFSSFAEVWETLAQRESPSDRPPRVWQSGDSWRLWAPELDLRENMWDIPTARPKPLLQWLKNGSNLRCEFSAGAQGWGAFLRKEVQKTLEEVKGRVWGLILSGPFVSLNPQVWMEPLKGLFHEKGLRLQVVSDPTIAAIWAPSEDRDIIAEGAFIYGCRREADEPTYLDTLPPLHLLAGLRGNYGWRNLIDAKECEGGKPYFKPWPGEFSLQRRSRKVTIYLRKGGKDAFRKATIHFPNAPDHDVPLDTLVKMTPASGRAEVEFRPESVDYLGGRQVFLDYSQMEEVTELELPTSQRGWPPTVKMNIDRQGTWLSTAESREFPTFLNLDFKSPEYCNFLGDFKKNVKKHSWLGGFVYLPIVDQDGKAGTPEAQVLIDVTAAKLGEDLRQILSYRANLPYDRDDAVRHIRQAATWLYSAASQEIIEHLLNELSPSLVRANDVFDAAGRSFTLKEHISVLYAAIERRLNSTARTAFPIQAQHAITNLLTYREFAPDALTASQAKRFTEKARDILQMYTNSQTFDRGFRQAAHLFIGLLRFRIVDRDFLNPQNPMDEQLFTDILTCLKDAQRRLPETAAKLIKEVELYMFFKGSDVSILQAISE